MPTRVAIFHRISGKQEKRDATLVERHACGVTYKYHSYNNELPMCRPEAGGYAVCAAEST